MKSANCPLCQPPGFTLIETLVSMMILAISLTVIMQLFSGGLHSGDVSEKYTRAVFLARQKMEETLLYEPYQASEATGRFDDTYGWQISIQLADPPAENEPLTLYRAAREIDLFRIIVKVVWMDYGTQKEVKLQTLKIGEKAAVTDDASDP